MFQDINDDEYHNFQPQQLTQEEALFAFFEEQRDAYSGGRLDGLFGGDGDYAYESLCFGLMLENAYHKVFRVWSRAWLVTK